MSYKRCACWRWSLERINVVGWAVHGHPRLVKCILVMEDLRDSPSLSVVNLTT